VNYASRHELWFCFPENGQQQPSLALVWNWIEDKFSMRDLCKVSTSAGTRSGPSTQGVTCIAPGVIGGESLNSWDVDSGQWDSDVSSWEARAYSPLNYQLLAAERSGSKLLYHVDFSSQLESTDYTVVFERTGLSIIGQDREGQPKNDNEIVKLLTEVWPRFESSTGLRVNIEIGTQQGPNEATDWGTPFVFQVGTDKKINCFRSGRFISLRFSWTSSAWAKLINYEMQLEKAGIY
jgi:hypothetical protein